MAVRYAERFTVVDHDADPDKLKKMLLAPVREVSVELELLKDSGEVDTFKAVRDVKTSTCPVCLVCFDLLHSYFSSPSLIDLTNALRSFCSANSIGYNTLMTVGHSKAGFGTIPKSTSCVFEAVAVVL